MRVLVTAALCAGTALMCLFSTATQAAQPIVASGHQAGQCLDIRSGSNDAVWACHGGSNQQLAFRTGSYGQINVAGRCLSTSGGAGTALVAASCSNTPAQRWVNTPEGFLRNEEGWCADVERQGGQGSRVIAWQCNSNGRFAASNQRWSFSRFMSRVELAGMNASGNQVASLAANASPGTLIPAAGVVAAGGANVVAAGGMNVVAAGGMNVVAAGGGNVIVPVSGVVAAGGRN